MDPAWADQREVQIDLLWGKVVNLQAENRRMREILEEIADNQKKITKILEAIGEDVWRRAHAR